MRVPASGRATKWSSLAEHLLVVVLALGLIMTNVIALMGFDRQRHEITQLQTTSFVQRVELSIVRDELKCLAQAKHTAADCVGVRLPKAGPTSTVGYVHLKRELAR